MKRLGKSTLNILLSLVLVTGLLPVNAYAGDEDLATSSVGEIAINDVSKVVGAAGESGDDATAASAAAGESADAVTAASTAAETPRDDATTESTDSALTTMGTLTSDDWYQCGTCEWIVDSGVLTIRPLEGETEGMLENWSNMAPWASDADGKDHRGYIQYVVVEEGVYASTCYNMFAGCKMLKSVNLSNLNTSNVTDMSYMFEGCASLVVVKLSDLNTNIVSNTKNMFKGCENLVYVDLSNFSTSALSSKTNMFDGCSALSMVVLKAGADFSNTKLRDTSWTDSAGATYDSSNAMLSHNGSLTSGFETYTDGTLRVSSAAWTQAGTCQWMVDSAGKLTVKPLLGTGVGVLPDWTLSNSASPWANHTEINTALFNSRVYAVTCNSLFAGCSNMVSVSLGDLYTVSVTDMSNMFYGCSSLSTVRLIFTATDLDLTLVSTTDNMFNGCTSLASVDLSGWETAQITSKKDMFANCSSLHMITLGDQADWSNSGLWNISWKDSAGNSYATTSEMMEHNASTPAADKYAETYTDGSLTMNPGWTQAGTCQWWIDSEGKLIVEPMHGLTTGVLPRWYGGAHAPWYYQNSNIKTATFTGVKAQTCNALFDGCYKMTDVDLGGLDTSAVTNMKEMFYGCSSLTAVNLYLLESSLVSNMAHMLSGCSKLKSISLKDSDSDAVLDTANVTDMSYMFEGCGCDSGFDLTLDLSVLDTSQLSSVTRMFKGCETLTTINLSGFTVSNISDLSLLFENCMSLTTIIGLSDWDTSAVTKMGGMFSGCSSLTTLDLSAWDTSNVTDINGMFAGCSKLTSFNLADIYNSKVTNINALFINCTSLETLDLSCLDPDNMPTMDDVVSGCSALDSVTLLPQTDFTALGIREAIWKDVDGAIFDTTADMVADNLGCTSDAKTYYALIPTDGWHIYGPCQWTIDENDNLIIGPLEEFEEATLPAWETNAPWYGEVYRTVKFNGSVTATTCKNMFFESALVSADLTNLVIASGADVTDMFLECDALTTLALQAGVNLEQSNLSKAVSAVWANTNNDVYSTTGAMFAGNANRTSGVETYKTVRTTDDTWTRCGACEWKVDDAGCLNIKPLDGLNTEKLAKLDLWYEQSPWAGNASIKSLAITEGVSAQTCTGMFKDCISLAFTDLEIKVLSSLDTSSVTNMSSMFEGCSSLTSVNVSYLDTSKVTDMNSMLKGCSHLSSVGLISSKLTQVTDMSNMLSGCSSLTSVNLSSFSVSADTNTEGMLLGCSSVTTLTLPAQMDLSNAGIREAGWKVFRQDVGYAETADMVAANKARTGDALRYDLLKATDGWNACGTCEWSIDDDGCLIIRTMDSLTTGTLAQWDTPPWSKRTEEIESFKAMYGTIYAKTCANMFAGCAYLTKFDSTLLDVSQATSFENMFKGCKRLCATLDLGGFNTANATNMSGMFAGDASLVTILVSSNFITDQVTDSTNMFMGCTNLMGQNGTPYGSSHTDKTYARIDTTANKGYFTKELHNMTKTDYVAPTYETPGTKAYWTCSICDKAFADRSAETEISDLDAWKAVGGAGYIAPLSTITVSNLTILSNDAFVSVKTDEGPAGLFKVTVELSFLAEGYQPLAGDVVMLQDGDTYVALVDQATADALSMGTQVIGAQKGAAEPVLEVTGDVNENGKVNIVDAQISYDMANASYGLADGVSMAQFLSADINGDGVIDALDARAIQTQIMK